MIKTNPGLYILIALFSLPAIVKAQTMDMAPLNAYWKMIEPLKKGDSLSVADWQKFLDIEPNKIYVENQGFDSGYLERLRQSIQIVYMPKYATTLAKRVEAIDKDPSSYWLTYKVYVYKKYEQELKAFQAELLAPGYIPLMYKNAFEWLPKRLQKRDTTLTIHLLGIENDAIAGPGIVIATLWTVYNQDKIKKASLAGHELHHALRKPIDFADVQAQDKGVMYFINATLNEGTADMIDKVVNLAHEEELPMGMAFREFLLPQADSIVAQADTILMNLQKSSGKDFKTEKDIRNLVKWTSGHNPGYYMTDIIVRQGYKKQLMKQIQNPFQFIYLYNKAAKKDNARPHVFSKEAVEYVREMEGRYWKGR